MVNAMLDARQDGDSYRRIEELTGERRRRRWTSEEKARIAAESFVEGANISEVARRNGVSRGLLTVWRRQVGAVAGKAQNFVQIQIGAESDGGRAGESECISPVQIKPVEIAASPAKVCGVVEIEMNGAHPDRAGRGAGDACDGAGRASTREGSLVVEAINRAQSLFPWLLRGVDFDNDSAFMNDVVVPWCRETKARSHSLARL
ncbi:transposase [Bradyrhizobium yuanmingense]|uniref:transposase n=1 Tax=Bradyrhizobium yuanmingense TaxID=108015 RepID=UPI0023B92CF7|nr:transposase [Bradyrhizobium yuanmingense]MDF0585095.1 transposase [Bradyrhizobium yuanmingense]